MNAWERPVPVSTLALFVPPPVFSLLPNPLTIHPFRPLVPDSVRNIPSPPLISPHHCTRIAICSLPNINWVAAQISCLANHPYFKTHQNYHPWIALEDCLRTVLVSRSNLFPVVHNPRHHNRTRHNLFLSTIAPRLLAIAFNGFHSFSSFQWSEFLFINRAGRSRNSFFSFSPTLPQQRVASPPACYSQLLPPLSSSPIRTVAIPCPNRVATVCNPGPQIRTLLLTSRPPGPQIPSGCLAMGRPEQLLLNNIHLVAIISAIGFVLLIFVIGHVTRFYPKSPYFVVPQWPLDDPTPSLLLVGEFFSS